MRDETAVLATHTVVFEGAALLMNVLRESVAEIGPVLENRRISVGSGFMRLLPWNVLPVTVNCRG